MTDLENQIIAKFHAEILAAFDSAERSISFTGLTDFLALCEKRVAILTREAGGLVGTTSLGALQAQTAQALRSPRQFTGAASGVTTGGITGDVFTLFQEGKSELAKVEGEIKSAL